jgi:hypothetical protein
MQEALRAEGWFVEWNMPCCQSCAWSEVEHDDLSKVLFNHSQDCEIDDDFEEECSSCLGDGMIDNPDYDSDEPDEDGNEQYVECDYCAGEGYLRGSYEVDYEPDVSVHGFACMPPEIAGSSLFCFDGSDEGVANFKEIIPIIEECGVTIDSFDESGKSRIELSW